MTQKQLEERVATIEQGLVKVKNELQRLLVLEKSIERIAEDLRETHKLISWMMKEWAVDRGKGVVESAVANVSEVHTKEKKPEEKDKESRPNGVERSYLESWLELRGDRNGDVKGGFNLKMFKTNSNVSWRSLNMMAGSFNSSRKNNAESNGNGNGKKKKKEPLLERNRSARQKGRKIGRWKCGRRRRRRGNCLDPQMRGKNRGNKKLKKKKKKKKKKEKKKKKPKVLKWRGDRQMKKWWWKKEEMAVVSSSIRRPEVEEMAEATATENSKQQWQKRFPAGLSHRNQRSVHLPFMICEVLRAFGAELICFLWCHSSCASDRENHKESKAAERSSESESSCGTVFTRWLVAVQNGDGKGREIEWVVGDEEAQKLQRETATATTTTIEKGR